MSGARRGGAILSRAASGVQNPGHSNKGGQHMLQRLGVTENTIGCNGSTVTGFFGLFLA
jgi:hypothetical protein